MFWFYRVVFFVNGRLVGAEKFRAAVSRLGNVFIDFYAKFFFFKRKCLIFAAKLNFCHKLSFCQAFYYKSQG